MTFENWWRSKYPTDIGEIEFRLLREAWEAAKAAEREECSDNSVLAEAEILINGDRLQQYGDPKKNLEAIACMWEMYLYHKYVVDCSLEPEDVCWMMKLLKMCREFSGKKRDSLVDDAGYTGLIEKVRK